ncbi:hypothetical protein PSQ90_09770 [Devosia rhodophyticola]|uniref:Uncharacterized protein n=1 Tax=Devosia rhodophyticola TaxID=3026423 RepID=A0ABY7YTW7_9HYPH|nr:hypothetical protein [Devosia rhodophyticola]WDR04617.1 hypothetical protein PSQ90_09770 [Devosia rhodophyticola]
MASLGKTTTLGPNQQRSVNWFGRSGRAYGLVSESLEQFRLAERELYLIAKGSLVLWVGSVAELVVDPMSRTRFKLALDCADRAFRLATPRDDVERMTTIWDLEGAEPETRRSAAA